MADAHICPSATDTEHKSDETHEAESASDTCVKVEPLDPVEGMHDFNDYSTPKKIKQDNPEARLQMSQTSELPQIAANQFVSEDHNSGLATQRPKMASHPPVKSRGSSSTASPTNKADSQSSPSSNILVITPHAPGGPSPSQAASPRSAVGSNSPVRSSFGGTAGGRSLKANSKFSQMSSTWPSTSVEDLVRLHVLSCPELIDGSELLSLALSKDREVSSMAPRTSTDSSCKLAAKLRGLFLDGVSIICEKDGNNQVFFERELMARDYEKAQNRVKAANKIFEAASAESRQGYGTVGIESLEGLWKFKRKTQHAKQQIKWFAVMQALEDLRVAARSCFSPESDLSSEVHELNLVARARRGLTWAGGTVDWDAWLVSFLNRRARRARPCLKKLSTELTEKDFPRARQSATAAVATANIDAIASHPAFAGVNIPKAVEVKLATFQQVLETVAEALLATVVVWAHSMLGRRSADDDPSSIAGNIPDVAGCEHAKGIKQRLVANSAVCNRS